MYARKFCLKGKYCTVHVSNHTAVLYRQPFSVYGRAPFTGSVRKLAGLQYDQVLYVMDREIGKLTIDPADVRPRRNGDDRPYFLKSAVSNASHQRGSNVRSSIVTQ